MTVQMTNANGVKLLTAGKLCEKDITVKPVLQDKTVNIGDLDIDTLSCDVSADEGYAGLSKVSVSRSPYPSNSFRSSAELPDDAGFFCSVADNDGDGIVENVIPRKLSELLRYSGNAKIARHSILRLSKKYAWSFTGKVEEATSSEEGYKDIIVKGMVILSFKGVAAPVIELDRTSTPVDEHGELRPPIVAKISGCSSYDAWVGICDADTTEYTYETVHDHWGYVQLGGDGTGCVYAELDTSLIPPANSTVVISRGNLCRNGASVLAPGNYKLVLFSTNLFNTDTYEAIAEAPFTLT